MPNKNKAKKITGQGISDPQNRLDVGQRVGPPRSSASNHSGRRDQPQALRSSNATGQTNKPSGKIRNRPRLPSSSSSDSSAPDVSSKPGQPDMPSGTDKNKNRPRLPSSSGSDSSLSIKSARVLVTKLATPQLPKSKDTKSRQMPQPDTFSKHSQVKTVGEVIPPQPSADSQLRQQPQPVGDVIPPQSATDLPAHTSRRHSAKGTDAESAPLSQSKHGPPADYSQLQRDVYNGLGSPATEEWRELRGNFLDLLSDPDNDIPRPAADSIIELLEDVSDIITHLLLTNARLTGQLVEAHKKPATPSYSQITAGQPVQVTRRQTTASPAAPTVRRRNSRPPLDPSGPLVPPIRCHLGEIKPRRPAHTPLLVDSQTTETPSEITKLLRANIRPEVDGIRIRKMTATKSGKVIIIPHAQQDLEKIVTNSSLASAGLTMTQTNQAPRVIIYDVPPDMPRENVQDSLWRQNNRLRDTLSETEYRKGILDLYQTRHAMRASNSIYIGWQRCRILDYIRPARCLNCLELGHVSKHCSQPPTCSHCGQAHTRQDCPNTSQAATCGLCRKRNIDYKHPYNSNGCPTYITAVRRQASRTAHT